MVNDPKAAGPRAPETSGRATPGVPWHSLPEDAVVRKLQTGLDGLDEGQVRERQAEFGPNRLPSPEPPSLGAIVLHQFKSPLIFILLAAGAIAAVAGDAKDAVFILAVILLNATIGTLQEHRAEKSAHALQRFLQVRGRVRRAGRQRLVPAEEIVPGDVVLLESGDKVPADLRLVRANGLAVDESFLTGESAAAAKRIEALEPDTPVADRAVMAYAGATVVSGRGLGLVVATGALTEVGKIARSVAEGEGAKPPLVLRMEKFARDIGVVVLAASSALGAVTFFRGMPLFEVGMLVIAMAVSAIPEGLPVAMTVALSLATSRMAKRHVIVRRLPAVESLGSCTVIASDKTGTLTVNRQTVKAVVFPDGARVAVEGQGANDEGRARLDGGADVPPALAERLLDLARAGVLCNEAVLSKTEDGWESSGDAIDVALLALGRKLGLDPDDLRRRHETVAEIPFESDRRFAARAVRLDGRPVLIVKGAFETVISFCATAEKAGGPEAPDRDELGRLALGLAGEGYRVLAVATATLTPGEDGSGLDESRLTGLNLLGFLGFIDPLRPEVKAAVDEARRAGIKVIMITGDHPATALAIARELGIAGSEADVVTGRELAETGDCCVPEFFEKLKGATVLARVSPEQKLQVVDALVRLGHFVAVTGDGVNDAPALRRANIGVAMGSGTDIAKDTASLIVTDDNFASIVAGVEEGRHAYANVRKVTLFLISTGLAELLLIGLAIVAGLPVPLLAVQILWLNLVTNGIQDVALAFEAGEKGVMDAPPRPPKEGIFNASMVRQVAVGALTMALVCFAAWALMIRAGWEETAARNGLLTLLVCMQFFHVLNCRSESRSAFLVPVRSNPVLFVGMAAAFLIHVMATEVPLLQGLLRTGPLPLTQWLAYAALASTVLLTAEAAKALGARRRRAARRPS